MKLRVGIFYQNTIIKITLYICFVNISDQNTSFYTVRKDNTNFSKTFIVLNGKKSSIPFNYNINCLKCMCIY